MQTLRMPNVLWEDELMYYVEEYYSFEYFYNMCRIFGIRSLQDRWCRIEFNEYNQDFISLLIICVRAYFEGCILTLSS